MTKKEKIVVIGAGFAGLNFVKRIDKRRFDVTVVDCNNFHSFPPLFYQVASCGLEPASISFPLRRELRKGRARGTAYHLGRVREIDMKTHQVVTDQQALPFDKLVIAAGTTNNFFGNNTLVEKVYTIKSVQQALRTRNEILDRLERASNSDDADKRRQLLSFVVVGGGPSGVEVAGALGEMKKYVLRRDYPALHESDVSITLLEGSGNILSAMSAKSQADARDYLQKLMVDVRTGKQMTAYDGTSVALSDGSVLPAGMVIWTAGVTAVNFNFSAAQPSIGHGVRLVVDQYNRVQGLSGVYAIGDIAIMTTSDYPRGHPQLAQVAIQQGRTLARNLNRPEKEKPFSYTDKGTMATVGRNMAVADIGRLHLGGRLAWMAWMVVHLLSLLGMRNKINVVLDWTWGYFNYSTSLRLLLHPSRYPLEEHLE